MSKTVDIPPSVTASLKAFRFSKALGHSAISFKINKVKLIIEEDETFSDFADVEELAEELPSNSPRYVVVSYQLTHKDGRTSTPMALINWCPMGAPPELMTLHASALSYFQIAADVSKVVEERDGTEGLTTEKFEGIMLGGE
ncbi:hypothetical protein BDY24DRAFT_403823 [Mrakia frigida]|uniref:Aim7p n=1 Tax=Mrakia frigida TaxID=29902 RepID=UPI003FCBF1E4